MNCPICAKELHDKDEGYKLVNPTTQLEESVCSHCFYKAVAPDSFLEDLKKTIAKAVTEALRDIPIVGRLFR